MRPGGSHKVGVKMSSVAAAPRAEEAHPRRTVFGHQRLEDVRPLAERQPPLHCVLTIRNVGGFFRQKTRENHDGNETKVRNGTYATRSL